MLTLNIAQSDVSYIVNLKHQFLKWSKTVMTCIWPSHMEHLEVLYYSYLKVWLWRMIQLHQKSCFDIVVFCHVKMWGLRAGWVLTRAVNRMILFDMWCRSLHEYACNKTRNDVILTGGNVILSEIKIQEVSKMYFEKWRLWCRLLCERKHLHKILYMIIMRGNITMSDPICIEAYFIKEPLQKKNFDFVSKALIICFILLHSIFQC